MYWWHLLFDQAVASEPLTLTVADNADGTGAVASVAGSSNAAAANAFYVQEFSGELGTDSWALSGSRTGDGDISVTLTTGFYFGYATSTYNGVTRVSPVAYFHVTNSADSVFYEILLAVQARVRLLSLSGIASESVVVRKLMLDRGVTNPCVVIAPVRDQMPPAAGTNQRDDVTYSVLVVIYDVDNQDPTFQLNLSAYLSWPEKIARAFRHQRLPGITGASMLSCTVEPGDSILPAMWQQQKFAKALLLKFTAREIRGMS